MAVRTITTSIALDGEQKFKQQIGEVNRELRNLKTEMGYTEEVFKGQANTTEALTKKSDLLKQEVEQQTEKVKALEKAVKESAEAYGETDSKTDNWRAQLNRAKTDLVKMQRELKDTEKYLDEAARSADGCAKSIDEFGKETDGSTSLIDKFNEKIGSLKGVIAGGIAAKFTIEGAKEVMETILDLEESTREYRSIMGSLEVSSQQAGYSTEETEEAYRRLYGVLGDPQTTATTLANLQALGLEQGDLLTLIDQTTGAWGRYGDSIPIDSLAESIALSARKGEIDGVLADVISLGAAENEKFGVTMKDNIEFTELSNKELEKLTEQERLEYEAKKKQYEATEDYNQSVQDATTAEDYFNIALQNCQTEAERADFILQTMSKMGLAQAGQSWRDLNGDIVDANESQQRMEDAMGRLGEAVAPAANAIRNVGAEAINFLADAIEGAIGLIQDFLGWWDKFTSTDAKKEVEERRTQQRTGGSYVKQYGAGESGSDNAAWSSRAVGLSWVPYDGFKAKLHEGEAVLTEAENRALSNLLADVRAGTIGDTNSTAPVNGGRTETINITVQSVLDGKKVGESVTRYQRNQERAAGR